MADPQCVRDIRAEGLGDVVAPANGQMRFKYLWKFLGANLTPLQGFLVVAQQCGSMVMPMNLFDSFTAIRTPSAAVPLLDNAPHRASLRIVFNLAETFLSAMFALWPAGTLVEMDTYVFCRPSASNIPVRARDLSALIRPMSRFRFLLSDVLVRVRDAVLGGARSRNVEAHHAVRIPSSKFSLA